MSTRAYTLYTYMGMYTSLQNTYGTESAVSVASLKTEH